ncbi:zonular occludens toxin domain-containing protein [Acinetobacter wuhouensis]|uniref:Zona occludens toxin N-terminal domain-containing protein n=1 Tax=Acinetobacter wuhouensis TaxID=1879050 RepID=A0A4Q7ADT9_9GAMM|nr:zonular occludens toxin domain-containing protein [Acinetobacter wuhouensis]RZG42755.1 hypothetical protein EXU28_18660 [Acinetobacter wuhouensis]
MSIIVSAPLGAGKTLYCMSEIDKISKKEPHKRIYTNIVGCSYPGVILIQSTINKPFDWRDLPNGSILIYDEAHEHPAFSKDDLLKTYQIDDSECIKNIAKINTDLNLKVKEKEELVRQERKKQEFKLLKAKEDILDIGRSLTMHRQFGIEIYFITQKPFKLNEAVKASVVEHLILRRLFKLNMATIYSFVELQEQFGRSTMKNALSWRFFFYPKQLYKFYVSAETHNNAKKIPLSLIFWLLLPILLFGSAIKDSLNLPFFQPILAFFGIHQKEEKPAQQNSNRQSDATNNASSKEQNDIDCNDLNNSHIDKCVAYNKEKTDRLNREIQANSAYNITYDANNPYGTQADIQYTATAKPVFAGCVKFNGKYQAYTQQGTKLNVSQSDCKRLIDDGDRPFNYFANQQNQGMNNANFNNQINPQNHIQSTSKRPISQEITQANNYVEPHLERSPVNGANAL